MWVLALCVASLVWRNTLSVSLSVMLLSLTHTNTHTSYLFTLFYNSKLQFCILQEESTASFRMNRDFSPSFTVPLLSLEGGFFFHDLTSAKVRYFSRVRQKSHLESASINHQPRRGENNVVSPSTICLPTRFLSTALTFAFARVSFAVVYKPPSPSPR